MLGRYLWVVVGSVLCFTAFFFVTSPNAQESAQLDYREELKQIDAQLKKLEDEQTRLKLSAARWDDKGRDWQFQNDMTQEAKRAFQKADDAKAQMKINQQHIDALKARKAKLLSDHPDAENEIQGST
ncbi:MAG: hypothetical protein V4492_00095 [Chlamydiota bacterium]